MPKPAIRQLEPGLGVAKGLVFSLPHSVSPHSKHVTVGDMTLTRTNILVRAGDFTAQVALHALPGETHHFLKGVAATIVWQRQGLAQQRELREVAAGRPNALTPQPVEGLIVLTKLGAHCRFLPALSYELHYDSEGVARRAICNPLQGARHTAPVEEALRWLEEQIPLELHALRRALEFA